MSIFVYFSSRKNGWDIHFLFWHLQMDAVKFNFIIVCFWLQFDAPRAGIFFFYNLYMFCVFNCVFHFNLRRFLSPQSRIRPFGLSFQFCTISFFFNFCFWVIFFYFRDLPKRFSFVFSTLWMTSKHIPWFNFAQITLPLIRFSLFCLLRVGFWSFVCFFVNWLYPLFWFEMFSLFVSRCVLKLFDN